MPKKIKNLYVLPFDHRSSFYSKLLNFKKPLDKKEIREVQNYKKIVFNSFKRVYSNYFPKEELAILIDEEFGKDIIKECKKKNIQFALTTEKSGQKFFQFEYAGNFKKHLKKIKPNFAKALVRYNPAYKKENIEQRKKIKMLYNFCCQNKIDLIVELLIPPTDAELKRVGTKKNFDYKLRPELLIKSMREFHKDKIFPNIWKLEAMERKTDWQKLFKILDKKEKIIVLGRGENKTKVKEWLKIAAPFSKNIGFAVGRTVFFKPLKKYRDGEIKKVRAIALIAKNFKELIKLWEEKHVT